MLKLIRFENNECGCYKFDIFKNVSYSTFNNHFNATKSLLYKKAIE